MDERLSPDEELNALGRRAELSSASRSEQEAYLRLAERFGHSGFLNSTLKIDDDVFWFHLAVKDIATRVTWDHRSAAYPEEVLQPAFKKVEEDLKEYFVRLQIGSYYMNLYEVPCGDTTFEVKVPIQEILDRPAAHQIRHSRETHYLNLFRLLCLLL